MSNIQQLIWFMDQFLAAADAAIANIAAPTPVLLCRLTIGLIKFGNLTTIGGILGTAGRVPISVIRVFKVPHTFNYHAGVQHGIGSGMVLTFDYYVKAVMDITTVRRSLKPGV